MVGLTGFSFEHTFLEKPSKYEVEQKFSQIH